jgi:uncharacterized membrane protein YuzA (DUF378 family)
MDENENKVPVAVDHFHPDNLEKYSFYWLLASLSLTVLSLLLGGYPIAYKILGSSFPFLSLLLTISWILTGAAAVYLLYRWNKGGKRLFITKKQYDLPAFLIATITGLNIGIYGVISQNILMQIFMNSIFYTIGGVLYAVVVVYLWKRWQDSGQHLFSSTDTPEAPAQEPEKVPEGEKEV